MCTAGYASIHPSIHPTYQPIPSHPTNTDSAYLSFPALPYVNLCPYWQPELPTTKATFDTLPDRLAPARVPIRSLLTHLAPSTSLRRQPPVLPISLRISYPALMSRSARVPSLSVITVSPSSCAHFPATIARTLRLYINQSTPASSTALLGLAYLSSVHIFHEFHPAQHELTPREARWQSQLTESHPSPVSTDLRTTHIRLPCRLRLIKRNTHS
ncbi:hypothetical protein LZ32DRAFT_266367 [Colletotrichum eremochloae]|nr:hypothetical protein LZ32DRAFT_266367 [Colletotrichum eremochloae]